MALTGYETKEECLAWLERPMDWAGTLAISASVWSIAMLGITDLSPKFIISLQSAALFIVYGLLVWQGKRLNDAINSTRSD